MRGAQRFAALGRAQKESAAAAANGKKSSWKNGSKLDGDDDDDDDDEESNGKVMVTAPSDVSHSSTPSKVHALQREGTTPLHAKSSEELEHVVDEARTRTIPKPPPSSTHPAVKEVQRQESMDTFLTAEEEEELRIPGSFDLPSPRRGMSVDGIGASGVSHNDGEAGSGRERESWSAMFKRMGLGRE